MTDPLFVADLATLKSKLRLTKLPTDSAANALLDEQILATRTAFYRRLGAARVGQILAIPFVINPTTENGVKRAIANTVEVKMVRVRLMRTLPVLFQDSSGDANTAWNTEAPYREAGLSSLDREIKRLEDEIEEDMQVLDGEEEQGAEKNWRVYDGVRECPAPRPGDSLRPYPRNRRDTLG